MSILPHSLTATIGLLLLAVACLAASPPPTTQAVDRPTTAPTARALVATAIGEGIIALRDPKLTRSQKGLRIRELTDQHVDFETLGRLALGQAWRNLPDAQLAVSVQQFKKLILATCDQAIDDYGGEDVAIIGDRQEPGGDWTVLTQIVRTKDNGSKQNMSKVDLRMRQSNGQWRAIDATIDGVSLAANWRVQCTEIIAKSGIGRLLELLQEKTAANDQADNKARK